MLQNILKVWYGPTNTFNSSFIILAYSGEITTMFNTFLIPSIFLVLFGIRNRDCFYTAINFLLF